MAKVKILNSQESDITIHGVNAQGLIEAVTFPGARPSADDARVSVPGVGEIDAAVLDKARRASPFVQHYFTEGWLRKGGEAEAPAPAPKDKKDE